MIPRNPASNVSPTGMYVSAITQRVHAKPTCSMTARNHAFNLATDATRQQLADRGYQFCKRCGA